MDESRGQIAHRQQFLLLDRFDLVGTEAVAPLGRVAVSS
jgi:hypothetical protein